MKTKIDYTLRCLDLFSIFTS